FFFSSRRRHTRSKRDWSSDVCSSDLSVACQPIEAPEYLRTHGKNLSPSLRIKKEIINITATVTKTDDAADAPEITPDAIDDIWPWMKDIASSISWSTCLASMLNGMSLTMPMSWLMPSSA